MKSRLLKLLSFLCISISLSSCDILELFDNNPLIYELSSDGESYIVSANINKQFDIETLTIPSTYEDKPVTAIANNAFYGWENLKSIDIPESVTSIGGSAFAYCKSLESIEFSSNIKVIGTAAFEACNSLKEVFIPENVEKIGSFVFASCSNIEKIEVDTNNKNYSSKENCNAIIDTKNEEVIAGCQNSFIPNGIKSIANGSFYDIDTLKSITIPESVIFIMSQSIQGCDALESIVVDKNNPYYDTRNNCNAIIDNRDNILITGCKNSIIPNTIQTIGDEAFKDCKTLEKITIPSSVTTIRRFAFYGCSSLENIVIPNTVKVMENQVFQECNSLKSVKIGDGLDEIDDAMFANCPLLEEIHLGRKIKRIGSAAFHNCPSIKEVYYKGSQAQWNTLNIEDNNEYLSNAIIHFNS